MPKLITTCTCGGKLYPHASPTPLYWCADCRRIWTIDEMQVPKTQSEEWLEEHSSRLEPEPHIHHFICEGCGLRISMTPEELIPAPDPVFNTLPAAIPSGGSTGADHASGGGTKE